MSPRVVIAGRPNVGKSSLFNALAGRRLAIVDPTPGVTRDVLEHPVAWAGRSLLLVDTGGIGHTEDPLAKAVRKRAEDALERADLVLLVVDARAGITREDRDLAARLRRLGKRVLVAANKCDTPELEAEAGLFSRLGFGEALPVSASERREIAELRERLLGLLVGDVQVPEEPVLRIAILGRRNVGKSTLVNALCGSDRVLVADLPGTTRDAVEVPFRAKGGAYAALDTAGLSSRSRLSHPIELYAASRSWEALHLCDVAFLVLDASKGIQTLDRHIAGEIRDAVKPVVLVANKWDLMGATRTGEYQAHLEDALRGLSFAPLAVISAKEGRNLKGLLRLARDLAAQSKARVGTAVLNRALERAVGNLSGPGGSRIPKIRFAAQVGTHPPAIVLSVNEPNLFTLSYRRTLEQRLRQDPSLPFPEVPIRLLFRKSGGAKAC